MQSVILKIENLFSKERFVSSKQGEMILKQFDNLP